MKITGRRTLWEGRFIKTELIDYIDRQGKPRTWEAVGRVGTEGVVVMVPFTSKGEVLLIRQFRPVVGKHVIELPAGLINPGEDPHQAARRELVEETGHDADKFLDLMKGSVSTGINGEVWHVIAARDVREADPETVKMFPPDETEDIEVVKVRLDDIYDALKARDAAGDHIDLKIFGLVELAKRAGG